MLGSIKLTSHGSFKNALAYLHALANKDYLRNVEQYARLGVAALEVSTPKDSGVTANSWNYEIRFGASKTEILWTNSNVTSHGDPIVILLQYGHGTGTGGYVRGRDFINPAMQSVFDDILDGVSKAVKML